MRGKEYKSERNDSPGPGAYEPKHTLNKDASTTYKIGNTSRKEIVSKEDLSKPGPGNYDVENANKSPSFTFHPRR